MISFWITRAVLGSEGQCKRPKRGHRHTGGKCVQAEVGIRVMFLQPKEYVGPPGIRMGKAGPWEGSITVRRP